MSSPLARRPGGSELDRASGRNLPTRIERAVRHEIDVVQGNAIVQAARSGAVEYVAAHGLQAVAGLSALEEQAVMASPLGEARYKAIVDTATTAIARIVADTGRY